MLLDLVNAAPQVKAEALPFLRIMFVCSSGMMVFFMLGGALRSAGDARTPMILGDRADGAEHRAQHHASSAGSGRFRRSARRARRWARASRRASLVIYSLWKLWRGAWVVKFPRGQGFGPDWEIIRSLFRFGLPSGIQGIAMNVGGMLMLAFIGSVAQGAAAQAAFAICYSQLFSLITWTSVGLMGAAAAVAGQNLGAEQAGARRRRRCTSRRGIGLAGAAMHRRCSSCSCRASCSRVFGMSDPAVLEIGTQLLRVLSVSGLFITVALDVHRRAAGNGRHEEPALHLDRLADRRAARHLLRHQADGNARSRSTSGSRSSIGHVDAMRAERGAVQPGQVAEHRGGYSVERRISARLVAA